MIAGRLGRDGPEPESREDEDVVGLADFADPAVDLDGVEWRPRRDQRTAVGPAQDVDRRRLRERGRVRQRHDDRSLGPGGHGAQDRLAERAAHRGRADEDGRPNALDRFDEVGEVGREAEGGAGVGGQGELALRLVEIAPPLVDEPVRIDEDERSPDGSLFQPIIEHRQPQEPGDTDPGRPGARQHDARLRERRLERAQARQHAADDDRRRALDVVVERRHPIPVAIEDAKRVGALEVLPLDDAAGPHLGDAGDERLDQLVIRRASQPRRPMSEIERVGEERRVVRPDVERDRERQRRMDAAASGVEGELADRDRHAARALVAEAEDPFVVGHDDEPDVGIRSLAEEGRDAVDVGRRDPRAASPADDVAELLACPADRRRVDDRQELLEMFGHQSIEQRRVPVLERRHPDVSLERVILAAEVLELEVDLLLDRQHAIRQQAAQSEGVALVVAEREVLGQQPAAEERRPGQGDRGRAGPRRSRRTGRGAGASPRG